MGKWESLALELQLHRDTSCPSLTELVRANACTCQGVVQEGTDTHWGVRAF